jgi:hypothetical protein
MQKIIQIEIENAYKEAVRNKYISEKIEGQHSDYLINPSQASLRDLCWEIFSSSPTIDDISVYRNFFKAEFNSKEEDVSITYTNKFKKVGAFFRGDKVPAKMNTVNFAAILVDFEDRPFSKFKKALERKDPPDIKQMNDDGVQELEEKDSPNKNDEKDSTEKETPSKDKPTGKLNLFRLFKRSKRTVIGTAVIFGLIASTICLLAFKKGCMQWSDNHYELVYCDNPIEGNLNEVILRDDNLLNFKKLIVCDTTTCFKPDGEAIVWYAKTGDKADFFNSNGNGRHPETKRSLRPITEYIKGKYKGDCPTK